VNIQALIFDLDGTAIPSKIDALPSQRVVAAVTEAKKHCHVSVATGRPLDLTQNILNALGIDDLCILNGGASLYSCKTKEYVWQQQMDPEGLQEIFFAIKPVVGTHMVEDDRRLPQCTADSYVPKEPVSLACVFANTKDEAVVIIRATEAVSGFAAHAMNSWTPGLLDVHITHELATKKHALQSLLARINVDHKHAMVVGDGGNDLPLFSLAGLKVAMGNASQDLKAAADWVAPTVDEDGLAVAIEKYILSPPLQ
jgi:HAD superfamily hydrolase (TIGR01484 family)